MLEVSGCLGSEKEISVGKLEKCIDSTKYVVCGNVKWKNLWGCQQVTKRILVSTK